MYSEEVLNKMTNLCYACLFKEVKDNTISFYNIDLNSAKALAVIHIANILNTISNTTIQVNLPLLKYWRLKRITHMKHLVRIKNAIGIDCTNFIKDFEWRNDKPGVFTDIYLSFYKRTNKDG